MKDEKYPISIKEIKDKVLPDEHRWCHIYWTNVIKSNKYKYWNKERLAKFHTAIVRELFRRNFQHNYYSNSIDKTLPEDLKKKNMNKVKAEIKKLFHEINKEVKVGGFTLVDKKISELEIGEAIFPMKGGRFKGCSVGRDKEGYFVFTHRARSKSYETANDIPLKWISWIESTGTKLSIE